eukprot:COSAG03_NODE_4901_length_1400_cov_72.099923_1_plen_43_part_01
MDAARELRTGEIYGQSGDGSLVFTYRTEAGAIAELKTPGTGSV